MSDPWAPVAPTPIAEDVASRQPAAIATLQRLSRRITGDTPIFHSLLRRVSPYHAAAALSRKPRVAEGLSKIPAWQPIERVYLGLDGHRGGDEQ